MGFLSEQQRHAIITAVQTDETTAAVWRSPAAVNGKVGARALLTSSIPIRVRPAGEDDSNLRHIPLANPLNATRISMVGKVAWDTDIQHGDELRIDGVRYVVEGVGTFTNARLAALSEVRT